MNTELNHSCFLPWGIRASSKTETKLLRKKGVVSGPKGKFLVLQEPRGGNHSHLWGPGNSACTESIVLGNGGGLRRETKAEVVQTEIKSAGFVGPPLSLDSSLFSPNNHYSYFHHLDSFILPVSELDINGVFSWVWLLTQHGICESHLCCRLQQAFDFSLLNSFPLYEWTKIYLLYCGQTWRFFLFLWLLWIKLPWTFFGQKQHSFLLDRDPGVEGLFHRVFV